MDKDEALHLALEELENCADLLKVFEAPIDSCVGATMLQAETAITAIKQALAAPTVQEPVKPLCKVGGMPAPGRMCQFIITGGKLCGHKHDCPHKDTTPPAQEIVCSTGLCHYKAQRPWVGLTDEDWQEIEARKATEAKLKEKNT